MSSGNQKGNPFGNSNSKKGAPKTKNFLETLRDGGNSPRYNRKTDIAEAPQDFIRKMLGVDILPIKASGEIQPGQSLDLEAVIQAERKENKVLKQRLQVEQRLREEDKVVFEKKKQELKLELHAVMEEVQSLAKSTQGLSEEVEVAAMQAPANPGVYHVIFFEKLREFIRSFRRKIEDASIWLHSANQRSQKKRTFWGQVAKSGSKRLLSPEDYLQRSAG